MQSASVLLIDDHGLVRHGLQLLMADMLPGLRMHAAESLAGGLDLLSGGLRPDLVLLDLGLPDAQGMSGLMRLREDFPRVPVVVCSGQDDRDTVLASLDRGAMGFISKSASPDELRQALHEVLVRRQVHLPRSVTPRPGSAGARTGLASLGLTERQAEVLTLVVQGLRNKEIARQLDISEVMVKKHLTPVLQRLGVPDRTRLLLRLSELGFGVGRAFADPGLP
jgi:DNA-binding NarL/FixJ family response regulator